MNNKHIVIDPPLRGQWAIMNPPGHPALAYDFLAVDDKRQPYPGKYLLPHLFARISVTNIYAWSQPVYAPFNGKVIACSDGSPDRERVGLIRDLIEVFVFRPKPGSPFSAFGGNYIVLKAGELYALFAHLRKGSVRVRVGDSVQIGQQLGEVGNSGASIQPHLHFQVMGNEDPFPITTELLPFKFKTVKKRIGKEWQTLENAEIKNGDYLRL